jgi:hypothetical protein
VDTDAASRLAKGLRESRVGATRVLAVRAEVQPDRDGEDAIFLYLTLSDPAGETWPNSEILDLRREVIRKATDEGIAVPIYLMFSTEVDQPQGDDEALF